MNKIKNRLEFKRPKEHYTEENFRRWSNAERCAFIENQINVLTQNNSEMARRLDVTDKTLEEMRQDAATLRKLAEAEHAARQTAAAHAQKALDQSADELLRAMDKTKSKGIYLPPRDILGKKGN